MPLLKAGIDISSIANLTEHCNNKFKTGVSVCLLVQPVRFDGGRKQHDL